MKTIDYEKQLRETIIKMDEYLTNQADIIFSQTTSPKDFEDYQIESGINIFGAVRGLIALAEFYQKNFENPKINKILERQRIYKENSDEALIKIFKIDMIREKEGEESDLEKWLNS